MSRWFPVFMEFVGAVLLAKPIRLANNLEVADGLEFSVTCFASSTKGLKIKILSTDFGQVTQD